MRWHWEEAHEAAFIRLKVLVANTPVLRYFDPKEPLTLSVDASSKGLGAAILQQDKPIAYASRALTKTQQNYAQIEKETLAIAFELYMQNSTNIHSEEKSGWKAIINRSNPFSGNRCIKLHYAYNVYY